MVNNFDSFRSLYPFTSHYFDLKSFNLHYLDEGEGEVLLFLHGNPTWSFYYRNLIQSFQNKYRCIAPDHIGCGFSDKPQDYNYTLSTHIDNLEQLVDSLGLKDITLVMHDWGGSIGMGLAVRQPKLIKRLVLFNTAAFLSLNIPFRIELCRKPVIGLLAIRCFNMFVRGVLRFGIKHKGVLTEQVRAGYLSPYNTFKNRIGNLRFVQDIPMDSSVQSYSVLENIEKNLKQFNELPILITWGGKDFPSAEIHIIDSAGHLVVEDSAKEVIERMRIFLGENNIY